MMTDIEPKKRRKRTQRSPRGGGRVTERDIAILASVYEYRFLTAAQIAKLHFSQVQDTLPGLGKVIRKKDTQDLTWTRKVLADLFHEGYLDRLFPPIILGKGSPQPLYTLDRAGIQLLQAYAPEVLSNKAETPFRPSETTLTSEFVPHTLAINDVRILMTTACQKVGYTLIWVTERELKRQGYDHVDIQTASGSVRSVPILPDSYFFIKTPKGTAHFFLELDRNTMTVERFQNKIRGYIAYYHKGGFLARFNSPKFRVLTVISAKTPLLEKNRAISLRNTTRQAGGANIFWFSPLTSLSIDNILHSAVWLPAADENLTPLFTQ